MKIKISPDKEKAKSILKMVENREKIFQILKKEEFSTILAENYYEILKELMVAFLLTKGIKTIGKNSHKELIEIFSKYNYLEIQELKIIDDLRIRRNKSYYEGKFFDKSFLKNKENNLKKIIKKIKVILKKNLA